MVDPVKGLKLTARMKAQAQRAAKAAKELERGVSTRAGAKKDVKRIPETSTRNLGRGFGLEQTGKGAGSRMATKAQRDAVVKSGRKRLGTGAGAAGTVGLLMSGGKDTPNSEIMLKDAGPNEKNKKAPKKYNVGVSKGGVPFKEAFKYNRGEGKKTFTWNGKKYTTELASEKSKKDAKKPAAKKKVGGIRRALFGRDGKMGGPSKGLFDNKVTRAFTKRDELNDLRAEVAKKKPKEVKNGGMMKSKGMSKGGAMKKKGYAMGGAVMKSKGGSKGGASRKPRGVGVATRGYGKAMK
tara:strand:- start:878 stop:1762 length:885 start_codon:yes stop_codon:yes gene_type:complete